MRAFDDTPPVTAVLGPTNTGKTHLAIERMLGHPTGMIGFPLRLLARENYDRIAKIKGRTRVALITGEERIIPLNPCYFVCTVESMPVDRPVHFLAVDEIQLAADPERGHIFTDRLLHARGLDETMFLGAETIRPLIRRLVPGARFIQRPRFSVLSYTGYHKLTRLPRRSAVVTFSATDVYRTAEMLRRQRGGTAVVLGALSPRTRNAQVEMYQSGDVDYLVATDAIGMGLNMDIDHVAFARLSKFDGRKPRDLTAPEIAQIAGRAGRHMADGTFGTTADASAMAEDSINRVENHEFPALESLWWRNKDLDFRGPRALLKSLERQPPEKILRRVRDADDHRALAALAGQDAVAARARSIADTRLLWEICQVPDFRKTLSDSHTRLLGRLFDQLTSDRGQLDPDWMATHIRRLDRTDGDIDALMSRLASIRTWTYVSHRPDWVDDSAGWQAMTRTIEDRLSDVLHERLTQRFVDRRSAILVKSLEGGGDMLSAVRANGEVIVEGEYIGMINGFDFDPDPTAHPDDVKSLMTAARRVLRDEIARRVAALEQDSDDAFVLRPDNTVSWRGGSVARLRAGETPLTPRVAAYQGTLVETGQRDRIAARVQSAIHRQIGVRLRALTNLNEPGFTQSLAGPARGIAFQLVEGLGVLPRPGVADLVAALSAPDRRRLQSAGVRIGGWHIYLPSMLKPGPLALRAQLLSVHRGLPLADGLPAGGAQSIRIGGTSPSLWSAVGFEPVGAIALRIDRLDAIDRDLRNRQEPFALAPEIASLAGLSVDALPAIASALGYRREADGTRGPDDGGGVVRWRRIRRRRKAKVSGGQERSETANATPARRRERRNLADDSPFAALRTLARGGAGGEA
ncbi:helicase-related protein [Fodinicurvata sp. EGI_FJ10296]|uniref:helicase-related protein n=1 Tax=Fodinicurvata sp. EGI_FJ10296 TaxID=3231908 RepID=UPI0034533623